jgi:catechol 2,3-dioxygenase-like lactoylglutathione lyase family enzyme
MDQGLTHIALPVSDLERSLRFYSFYGGMVTVHARGEQGESRVAWVSDLTRNFVVVLVESERVENPLGPFAHLGIAIGSLAEFHRLCECARSEGVLTDGPTDSGFPVGYWAFLKDPDGHTVELSYGQNVEWAVENHRDPDKQR